MSLHSGYCLLREHQPAQDRADHLPRLARRALVGLFCVLLPACAYGMLFLLGAAGNKRDHVIWEWDDGVALLASVVISTVFVLIGLVLGARQAQLGVALANAAIEDRLRRMQSASFRSIRASTDCGLEVVHAGLTVLPTFALASADDQVRFLDSLTRCYGSLTLNSFPRNRKLPQAEVDELRRATSELAQGVRELTCRRTTRHMHAKLRQVADFLDACLAVENWYRRPGEKGHTLSITNIRQLYLNELQSYCCWADPTVTKADTADEGTHQV